VERKSWRNVTGKRKQVCRICKKRAPWKYKNCPPGVCKRCYHRHVWPQRPAARTRQTPWNDLPGDMTLDDDIFPLTGDPGTGG
jgi:hypothetical protein